MDPSTLPAVNACLNGLATILLCSGVYAIKKGNEQLHIRLMVSAFACSCVFLVGYLSHHFMTGLTVSYAGPDWGRTPYLIMLLVHTVFAAEVPFLAIHTIRLGLRDDRPAHKKWARRTFPIWLFVSITGVLIYFILYQWTPSWSEALQTLQGE